MFIRKFLTITAMIIAMAIVAVGCNISPNNGEVVDADFTNDIAKIKVITSFYPLYDFTKKIGGEHVDAVNLIPAGVDSHDWTPTFQDMARINNADVLIYNGLGFEGWIDSFLGSLDPSSMVLPVEASQGIQLVEWLGHGHDDDHEHHQDEHDQNHDHQHGEYDPHVWLSPLQAKSMAENIKNALIEVDVDNEVDYTANYEVLIAQLDELHKQFTEVTSNATRKDIVVSHEAYGYLTRDYGLNQIGVMGLSPSAEPTPQTMKHITDFVRENNIRYILFEELVTSRIAETLASEAGIETLTFNPLEGLTEQQAQAGEDYFSIMHNNLTTLKKALQ